MNSPKIFFVILFFLSAGISRGQSVTIKASVDKNRILIGERLQLRLEAEIPENEPIRFFLIDSIPHFEFLEQTKTDTINTNSGTRLVRVIPLTSFDSGHWVIPSFTFSGNLVTDSLPIDVVFSDFDPTKDYHDIKDIIEIEPTVKKQWWWYAAGGGLLLLLALIYFLTRKKKAIPSAVVPETDPYKEAMESLESLRSAKPDPKLFYIQLVNIFRLYVFRRKNILSLQKTTDDLVIQLRNLEMSKESFDRLAQALRLSDYVKFAKYIPSKEDDQASFETIKRSIEEIESVK
jgi:hypothetical protein